MWLAYLIQPMDRRPQDRNHDANPDKPPHTSAREDGQYGRHRSSIYLNLSLKRDDPEFATRESSMKLPHTGGCQCGRLRYEISQPPVDDFQTRHCTKCSAALTSSASSIGMIVDEQVFHLTGIAATGNAPHRRQRAQLDEVGMSRMRLMDMQRRKAWIAEPQHILLRARRNLG